MKKHLYFIASVFCPFFLSGVMAQEIERMSSILPVDEEIEQIDYATVDVKSIMDKTINMPMLKAPIGFTPDMINNRPIPNPIEKVGLIKPPYANSQGSVKLAYDFEFTPAKNGEVPDFRLSYDSRGGYGLLGMGWDMLLPKVVVDTTVENWKENYGACFLNGQRFIPVNDDSKLALDQDQDVEYRKEINPYDCKLFRHSRISYERDEDGKVVKDEDGKGKLQGVYIYWELVNHDGRRMVFGNVKNPFHFEEKKDDKKEDKKDEFANNSRLLRKSVPEDGEAVPDTIVAEWNISYQHDFYGNYVDYMYKLSNGMPFVDSITVGNANKIPHTIIKFGYKEQVEGADSVVHYKNYGMNYSLGQLLESIDFSYESDTEAGKYDYLRGYHFGYVRGVPAERFRNHAKVLKSIKQIDDQKHDYATHVLDYYDDKDDIRRRKEYYRNTQDKSVLPFLIDRSLLIKNIHNPLGGCMTFDYKTSDYRLKLSDLPKEEASLSQSSAGDDGIEYAPIEPIKYPVDSFGHIMVMSVLRVSNGIQNFVHDTFDYKRQVWNLDSTQFFGFDEVQTHVLDPQTRERVKSWVKEYDLLDPQLRDNLISAKLFDAKMSGEMKTFALKYDIKENGKFYNVNLLENEIKYPATNEYTYLKISYLHERETGLLLNLSVYTQNNWVGQTVNFAYLKEEDTYGGMWGLLDSIGTHFQEKLKIFAVSFKYEDSRNPDRVTSLTQDVIGGQITGDVPTHSVTTTFRYDADGNMIQVIYPKDANGANMKVDYLYDRRFNMYLNRVENSLGYRTELSDYDYHYGVPRSFTDRNGMRMEQNTDGLGHVISITAPYELERNAEPTLKYEFSLAEPPALLNDSDFYPFRVTLTTDAPEFILDNTYGKESLLKVLSYFYKIPDKEIAGIDEAGILHKFNVCTTPWNESDKKKDIIVKLDSADASKCLCKDSTDNLAYSVKATNLKGETMAFADGLGRIAQTKQLRSVTSVEVEGYTKDKPKDQHLVTFADDEPMYLYGKVYGQFAGEISKRRSYLRGGKLLNVRSYNEYGLLSSEKNAEGTLLATHSYQMNGAIVYHKKNTPTYLEKTDEVDFDGLLLREKFLSSTEGQDSLCRRTYDKMGRLTEISENGKSTSYKYDMRGLAIKISDPTNGTRDLTYDDAGNLISISKNGKEIVKYKYELNQLVSVEYPDFPYKNVRFSYGDKNAKYNRVGQIAYVEDAVGVQEFFYGSMGEVTKVRRSIVAPNRPIRTYEMTWDYNSFNYLMRMTYPDQEMLSYTYDYNGFPLTVTGSKSYAYKYVRDAGYDLFGRPTYLSYCNGEKTFYSYNDDQKSKVQKVYSERDAEVTMVAASRDRVSGDNSTVETELFGNLFDKKFDKTSSRWVYSEKPFDDKTTYSNEEGGNVSYKLSSEQYVLHSSTNDVSFTQTDLEFPGNSSMGKTYSFDEDGRLITENMEQVLNPEGSAEIRNDGGFLTTYWYDYKGYPVISTAGGSEGIYVNGESFSSLEAPSLKFQLNKYFSMDDTTSYTKHIYFGDKEVVRKAGDNESYGQNPEREERAGTYFAGAKSDYKDLYDRSAKAFKDRYALLNLDLELDPLPYRDGKDFEPVAQEEESSDGELKSSNINQKMDKYEEYQYYFHRIDGDSLYYLTNLRASLEDVIIMTPFESKRLFKYVK